MSALARYQFPGCDSDRDLTFDSKSAVEDQDVSIDPKADGWPLVIHDQG
jgi:hypothetical protein